MANLDTTQRPATDPKLRAVVKTLGLSEVWVRRQLRKGLDTLIGQYGYKDDEGHWRVPQAVVDETKKELEGKWARMEARARGELKDASHQYVPDRVKAPAAVTKILTAKSYGLNAADKAKFLDVLSKIETAETKAWKARAAERANAKK